MKKYSNVSNWNFYNSVNTIFEIGAHKKLNKIISAKEPILLITSKNFISNGTISYIAAKLNKRIFVYGKVNPNPPLDELDKLTSELKNNKFKFNSIIAVGGGSVIDTAKVLSFTLKNNKKNILHKIFRKNQKIIWQEIIPTYVLPTTSGSGSEATCFATIWDDIYLKKYSLSNALLYPKFTILDPSLTTLLPKHLTLITALDAISHSLESLWNKNKTEISESLSKKSLNLSIYALPKILKKLDDIELRSKLMISSYLAGIAISQTRTAIAHSISYPLTLNYNIPHGLAASFTLKTLIKQNIKYLSENEIDKKNLNKLINILSNFKLNRWILSYASCEEIISLKKQMITKNRSDNYINKSYNLEKIIYESLKNN